MVLIRRIALAVVGVMVLVYAADYSAARFPFPKGHQPLGVITVRPYLAVPQKSGKSEFYFLDPKQQTCVNSLLPHLGYNPCWYVQRHRRQRIDM
jgi:hypothetical protein